MSTVFDRPLSTTLIPVNSNQNLSAQQQQSHNVSEMGHSRNSSNTSQVREEKDVEIYDNLLGQIFRCPKVRDIVVVYQRDSNIQDKVLMATLVTQGKKYLLKLKFQNIFV